SVCHAALVARGAARALSQDLLAPYRHHLPERPVRPHAFLHALRGEPRLQHPRVHFVRRRHGVADGRVTMLCARFTVSDIRARHASQNARRDMKTETTMTLDDIYGSDHDRFPLEQDARAWDAEDLGLVWDEAEFQEVANDLSAPRRALA